MPRLSKEPKRLEKRSAPPLTPEAVDYTKRESAIWKYRHIYVKEASNQNVQDNTTSQISKSRIL